MAVSSIDTERVSDLANEILFLENDYEIQINRLFKMLSEVPYITKEWVGNQSERYFRTILLDKNDYINFGKEIRKYARKILDDSERMSDAIEETQKNERK